MGNRSVRQRMGFVKQVCRDVFMQTYWELTRAAGDRDQRRDATQPIMEVKYMIMRLVWDSNPKTTNPQVNTITSELGQHSLTVVLPPLAS